MHRLVMSVWLTAAVASAFAQIPAADLARPPSSARHFIIQSTGGKHGDSWSWVAPDGTRMARESMNLRGQVFELDSSGKAGTDGMPATLAIRGVTPQGDAAETFTVSGGTAAWKSPIDAGTAAYSTPAFYVSQGGPIDTTAWFLEALLARPDKSWTCCRAARRTLRSSSISRWAPVRPRKRSRSGRSPASAPRRCRCGRTRTTNSSRSPSESPGCRKHMRANRRPSRRRRRRRRLRRLPVWRNRW